MHQCALVCVLKREELQIHSILCLPLSLFLNACSWPTFDQILIYMLMVKIWHSHWLNVNIWNQFLNNNCFKTKLRIAAIRLPHQVSQHTNQSLKLKQEYILNFTTIFICLYERLTARGLEIGDSVFEVQYMLTSPNCPSTSCSHGQISQLSLQLYFFFILLTARPTYKEWILIFCTSTHLGKHFFLCLVTKLALWLCKSDASHSWCKTAI